MKRVTLLAVLMVTLATGGARAQEEIVDASVTFDIVNTNRSKVPCPTDGASYQIHGDLVAPRSALADAERAVTLYLHGALNSSLTAWRFPFPGYDHPLEMANLGHASVVIDRLGYGRSGIPFGFLTCLGGQADVTHQVIQQLRAGTYQMEGLGPVSFSRVAIAGHSYGGPVSGIEAYSFKDADALVEIATAFDQGFPPALTAWLVAHNASVCARGGEQKSFGGPLGYVFSFPGEPKNFYYDPEPAVKQWKIARLERDACGDHASLATTLAVDRVMLGSISVPVLLLCAEHDIAFPPKVCDSQRNLFSGSPDASIRVVNGAGHDLPVERQAHVFRALLADWLDHHGF